MGFTLFNPKLFKTVKNVKLKSFNEKSYSRLLEANEFYNQLHHFYLGLSGHSHEYYRKKFTDAVKSVDVETFRAVLNQYKKDSQCIKAHGEYLIKQKVLNLSNWQTWDSMESIDRKSFRKLYTLWSLNAETNYYSSEAIFACTHYILPLFKNFNELANLEFKAYKKKFPREVNKTISNYLAQLRIQINQEQTKMCEAILSRLEIADLKNNITYDDVTHYILQEINQLGIKVEGITNPRYGMNSDIFCYFHSYILKDGNTSHKMRLKKLSWLKFDTTFYSQQIDDQIVIIPQAMKKFNIPTYTRQRFKWWFNTANFCADFFKKRFYLLVKIRNLSTTNSSQKELSNLLEEKSWQRVCSLEEALLKEKEEALSMMSSWTNRLFYRKYMHFQNEWNIFLSSALQKCLQQKVEYAELLADQLQTRLSLDLDQDLLNSEVTKQRLRTIIKSTEDTFCHLHIKENDQWLRIKRIFLQTLKANVRITRKVVDESDQEETNTTQTLLKNFSLQRSEETETDTLCEKQDKQVQLILNTFSKIIKDGYINFQEKYFDQNLTQLDVLLRNICNQNNDRKLDVFWANFISAYLKTCLSGMQYNTSFCSIMKIILNYAPNNIKERIIKLEDSRQMQSIYLYQTRCHALLFSFKEQINVFEQSSDGEQLIMRRNSYGS